MRPSEWFVECRTRVGAAGGPRPCGRPSSESMYGGKLAQVSMALEKYACGQNLCEIHDAGVNVLE